MSASNRRRIYVDGAWQEVTGDTDVPVTNPTTGETIARVRDAAAADVDAAIDAAVEAKTDWGLTPAGDRGDHVRGVAELLRSHTAELAEEIVREQGKPLEAAKGEVQSAADLAEYMAEWDRRIEGDILPGDERGESIHLLRRPHGVVAAITPWNYPIAVFVRKLAPALVTGNTVVAKPSEQTPLATLRLVDLIDERLDLPDGVVNLVTGRGSVGERLVTSPNVDMVTLTGHVETGKQIMKQAAENLTRVSLELGGKAPAIVWKDTNLDEAVDKIRAARVTNSGQVCTCAERIYAHSDVYEEFATKYVDEMDDLSIGDPFENPDMGPLVSEQQLEKVEQAVDRAIDEGGSLLAGGSRPSGSEYEEGYWYEPTVISNVHQDMDIVKSEVFGPVSPIMPVDSFDEALEYANDSKYGLSSYVYTDNYQLAMRFAEELEFGETYINRSIGEAWQGHHIGWNESGMGGEDGKYGMLKYTQLKSVYHNYNRK